MRSVGDDLGPHSPHRVAYRREHLQSTFHGPILCTLTLSYSTGQICNQVKHSSPEATGKAAPLRLLTAAEFDADLACWDTC